MTHPIKITSEKDISHISKVCAQSGENVLITYKNITIDPRSVLGLFAIIGKMATLVGPDHMDPAKFVKLVKQLGITV